MFNANDNPLKDRHGTAAERNIVQFVPFKGINIKEGFSLVSKVAVEYITYEFKHKLLTCYRFKKY